jgi:hypothetical protein
MSADQITVHGAAGVHTVRVVLPAHLRVLAGVSGEVPVTVEGVVSTRSVLNALEADHPQLAGTIRDRRRQGRVGLVV